MTQEAVQPFNDLAKFTLLSICLSSFLSYVIFIIALIKHYYKDHWNRFRNCKKSWKGKYYNKLESQLHPFNDNDDEDRHTKLNGNRQHCFCIFLWLNLIVLLFIFIVFIIGQYILHIKPKPIEPIEKSNKTVIYEWLEGATAITYFYSHLCTIISCFIFSKLMYGIQRKIINQEARTNEIIITAVNNNMGQFEQDQQENIINTGTNIINESDGTRIINGGSNTINGGMHCINDGSNTVNGGRNNINGGTNTIKNGIITINGGTNTIRNGIITINGGTNTIRNGIITINGGTNTIDGGTVTINGGTNTINSGTVTINGGSNTINNNICINENNTSRHYSNDRSIIVGGSNTISGGTNTIKNGSNIIKGGENIIDCGSNTINGGINTINNGSNIIISGTNEIKGGLNTIIAGNNTISGGKNSFPSKLTTLMKADDTFITCATKLLSIFQLWFFVHWVFYIITSFLSIALSIEAILLLIRATQHHTQPGVHFSDFEIPLLILVSASNVLMFFYPCFQAASITRARKRYIRHLIKKYKDDDQRGIVDPFVKYLKSREFGFRLYIGCTYIPFSLNLAYTSVIIGVFGIVVSVLASIAT